MSKRQAKFRVSQAPVNCSSSSSGHAWGGTPDATPGLCSRGHHSLAMACESKAYDGGLSWLGLASPCGLQLEVERAWERLRPQSSRVFSAPWASSALTWRTPRSHAHEAERAERRRGPAAGLQIGSLCSLCRDPVSKAPSHASAQLPTSGAGLPFFQPVQLPCLVSLAKNPLCGC